MCAASASASAVEYVFSCSLFGLVFVHVFCPLMVDISVIICCCYCSTILDKFGIISIKK